MPAPSDLEHVHSQLSHFYEVNNAVIDHSKLPSAASSNSKARNSLPYLFNDIPSIMASKATKSTNPETQVLYRQIRALYDEETITVYQAYSAEIAEPAVKEQSLTASPKFSGTRMTWIKPSWCWMMFVFL